MGETPETGPAATPAGRAAKTAVKLVLVALAALLSGLGVVRALAPDAPAPLAAAPGGEEATRRILAAALKTPADPRLLDISKAALAVTPASELPLVAAGVAFRTRGETARSDRAFALALARNPRNTLVRAWALDEAAREGRFGDAIRQGEAMMAVYPGAEGPVLDWMAAAARDARARAPLLAALGRRPPWAGALIDRLIRDGADPAFWLEACRLAPKAQARCLEPFVAAGRHEEAYLAWLSFQPRATDYRAPYDGTFKGLPGAAPFNWSLNADAAEIRQGGGLEVIFDGQRRAEIAGQMLLLGPGVYTFRAVQTAELRPRGAVFRWRIACIAGPEELAIAAPPDGRLDPTRLSLEVRTLGDGERALAASFEIPPAGCPAQRLTLDGVAGEMPLWARATVARVEIADGRPGAPAGDAGGKTRPAANAAAAKAMEPASSPGPTPRAPSPAGPGKGGGA